MAFIGKPNPPKATVALSSAAPYRFRSASATANRLKSGRLCNWHSHTTRQSRTVLPPALKRAESLPASASLMVTFWQRAQKLHHSGRLSVK